MDTAQFISILGCILSALGILYMAIRNFREDLDKKFSKLGLDIQDMDRRLCRIEGALSAKECCMLKDPRTGEKAN